MFVCLFVCCVSSSGSINTYGAGANSDDTHERQCLHKMRQRPSTGQHYLHHEYHHRDRNQNDDEQVTAREGKPILIIEEGDAETAACAEHSLEVASAHHDDHHSNADGDDDHDNHPNDDGGDTDYFDDDTVDTGSNFGD